ncbi:MAG: fibro-slime domain-containing protein [Fibrobacteres bacterium]|nr:fibro-slime domain-containing protein [Fibrobacterota bacterium]
MFYPKTFPKGAFRGAAFALAMFSAAPALVDAQQASPLTGKVVHILNPFTGALPLVDLSGSGYTMTEEGPNWYRFDFNSIGGSLQPWMNSFQIRTADWKRFGPAGMTTTDAPFSVDLFGAGTDIWIVVDPAGPPDGPPLILTKPPGTVHLFNPWPANGPKMILNGNPIPMTVDRANCGWYIGYTLPITPLNAYFTNVADGQAFGAGGLDDKTPFDLVALYAAKGSDVWIASQTEITGTNPGKVGSCTYQMAATVHDMSTKHPDYGSGGGGPGMVQSALGADHKPVPTAAAPGHFNTWFNTDTAAAPPLKGAETCLNLEMGKSDDGLWEFDDEKSMPDKGGFFPIDDWNTLDANQTCTDVKHNYGFCLESHATFVYQKGQVFDFRGDDDVWVYINNKLALDIGGIHPATPGSINLDTLGLKEGQPYPWDFFFCERNMCGSSLRIKTTIYFKQQRALDHAEITLPGGGTGYRVIKRIGGTGACGSSGDALKEVAPGPLTFVLYKVGGDSIQELPKKTTSFGGVVIGDSTVSVDTTKVTGLAPGQYRIVFYETASPRLRDEVRFTVAAHNVVEFDPPYTVSVVVGTMVKVVAANRFKDSLVAGAVAWTPSFPAGALVYTDSSRSTRVTPGASLTTAATGLDTLWVAGDPAATADQTFIFSITGSSKTVKVTFTLPPLDLPKAVSAGIYDDDGDGRGDRLEVTYDPDITATLPKAVAYRWPSSAGADSSLGTDLASKLQAGKTLVFSGKALSAGILTAGEGVFKSTYPARGKDSTQTLPIQDHIGPVIRTATLHLGQAYDTLRLEFSEPIASRSAKPEDMFGYKLGDSSAAVSIAPHDVAWDSTWTAVTLVFASSVTPEPKAGDFVRLNDGPGLAADAAGNRPGPQTRFHLITGDKRGRIFTVTYREIPPDPALFSGPVFQATLEASGADVKDVVNRTGRMGFLLEADPADYAAGDGVTVPEPSQVALEYQAVLFTNLGVPVVSSGKRSLLCTDAIFQGDCRAHRGRVFIGWNYASDARAKVATGAYVAMFDYQIKVQGKSQVAGSVKQIWGLLRKK